MGRRTRDNGQLSLDERALGTYLPGTATLADARRLLTAGLAAKGVECPCCRQLAKIYKRKLNSAMTYALILIFKRAKWDDDWIHVPRYLNGFGVVARGGDWSKLQHWGFIVERPEDRDDGCKHAGEWKLTDKGRRFVSGAETASKHLFFYNQQLIALSSERTFIREALGSNFRYDELMAS